MAVDVVLAGGGLANCLIAYRLSQARPDVRLTIVEADVLGGNHTWCFHETDLTPRQRTWMAPFVARVWDGYRVRFPDRVRRVGLRYCGVTADRLRSVMASALRTPPIRGRATSAEAHRVALDDGALLEAPLVLDGRGAGNMDGCGLAWQAFLGLQVRLAAPHGLSEPVVMDADIPQEGAYRFFYCLPMSETELLIEDTRYGEDGSIDPAAMRAEIHRYAQSKGWRIETLVREEQGSLPIVLSGSPTLADSGPVPVGARAGLFHFVTGYSLPDAVRLADAIAAQPELTSEAVRPLVLSSVERHWRRHGFYRLLNRMLFMAGAPNERWRMLSRFYALPEPLIARFYAGSTTASDRLRILAGRPPVPVLGALACLPPSSARSFVRPVPPS